MAQAAAPGHRATVWSGVYTERQARRGETAYTASCSGCHQSNLSGYDHLLTGEKFMDHWREDNLASFYHLLKSTMPRGAPASLGDRAYLDITAYILETNEFPPGKTELTLDSLARIQIEGKNGPQPVPDSALVRTVGCLVQNAKGEWMVEHATEARRTREPHDSSPAELKAASQLSGNDSFRFLHVTHYDEVNYHLEEQKGRKVEAKGFLIRNSNGSVLNLTSVATAGNSCP
jgi:hypothetical protein